MMKLWILCALTSAGSLTSASKHQSLQARQVGQTVNTTSGPVGGHAASNATGVSEYLGIPYAQPPVGELRFAVPVPYTGNSSINGTKFGFSCPTTTLFEAAGGSTSDFNIVGANLTTAGIVLLSTYGQIGDVFSEDCLTLNVWTPSGGEAKKAVLLWIYGGGFTTGSSDTSTYNGQYIASQEDVILVSFNYRLNIFGFPGNPSVPNQNLGLLDQRLAVEWVRDNIAAFGGDPTRITIFGQSAGSASIDYYSYAYKSDPIVAGFILESGTVNGFGSETASNATSSWFSITSAIGCGSSTSNSTDVLTCMRAKNSSSILTAVAASNGSSFGPTVDDLTVFSDYPARSLAGNFIKVPLLIGNNDYEAGLSATLDALQNETFPASYWEQSDLITFTCPAAVRANISIAAGVPTWRYRYFGDFPNLRLTTVPDSGAWHTAELPLLFNNLPSGGGIPASTTEEVSIGNYLRGAWAAFAKDPVHGLGSYQGGWPTYSPSGETLVRLAYNNVTGTNLAMPIQYDGSCNITFAYNGTNSSTASPTATGTTGTSPSASSSSKSSAGALSSGGSTVWFCSFALAIVIAIGTFK